MPERFAHGYQALRGQHRNDAIRSASSTRPAPKAAALRRSRARPRVAAAGRGDVGQGSRSGNRWTDVEDELKARMGRRASRIEGVPMIIVDTALKARAEQGKPIRVGMIGAGFMAPGPDEPDRQQRPGMRVVGDLQPARRRARSTLYSTAGLDPEIVDADTSSALEEAIRARQAGRHRRCDAAGAIRADRRARRDDRIGRVRRRVSSSRPSSTARTSCC